MFVTQHFRAMQEAYCSSRVHNTLIYMNIVCVVFDLISMTKAFKKFVKDTYRYPSTETFRILYSNRSKWKTRYSNKWIVNGKVESEFPLLWFPRIRDLKSVDHPQTRNIAILNFSATVCVMSVRVWHTNMILIFWQALCNQSLTIYLNHGKRRWRWR